MDENGFDYDLHKKLTQAGLMGIHLDEKYGGGGGDAVSKMQTGHVQDYSSVVLIGVAVLSVVLIAIAVILGGM